jgi:hypothetical protein
MNKKLRSFLLLAVATSGIATHIYAQPKLSKSNVKKVVTAMTLDEKAHPVVGMGMRFGLPAARKDSSKAPVNTSLQGPVIGAIKDKVSGAINETKPTAANSTSYIEELNGFAIGM